MSTAIARDAKNIWIVNVGDLKPYEMHTEFFLTYGYDPSKWNPQNINSFVEKWAQREFDMSASDAAEVASLMRNVTRHNARRKPELWNSTTYSLTNYREYVNFFDPRFDFGRLLIGLIAGLKTCWQNCRACATRQHGCTTRCQRKPRVPSSSSCTIQFRRRRL